MNFAIWKTHKLPMDNLRLFWLLQQKSKDFNKNVLPILKLPYLLYCYWNIKLTASSNIICVHCSSLILWFFKKIILTRKKSNLLFFREIENIIIIFLQSVVGNVVAFRVHAPSANALLLDIFANAVTPQEYLTGEPMKFKSVCKFKIVCEDLQTVMVPLPDCASGEWGPAKATRLV